MEEVQDERAVFIARSCAEMSVGERKAFLDRICKNDAELRRQVEIAVGEKPHTQVTQVYANDYERALPDHYRLIQMIGRGGMAEVFAAEDKRLKRRVAIKFLNSEFRKDPDRMRRFNQEARAASALNHPNILIIHDIGENEGVQFIVSEFVEGETLGTRLLRGRIPLAEAVEIAIQIASALSASHRTGIVHRDIKPDNVMLRTDGSVKVLDFGLAKDTGNPFSNEPDFDANTLDSGSTSPGLILGTPQYMSPEQARGTFLDRRTDVFSLGILIFEMVTGHSPFPGKSMIDIIAAIIGKEPQRVEEYIENPPLRLIRIINRALQKNRDDRYDSVDQLLSDLKDLRHDVAGREYIGRDTANSPRRRTLQHSVRTVAAKFGRWEPILVVLVAGCLVSFAWWYFRAANRQVPPVPSAMRSVPITSWSSGPGELMAAASFSPDAKMIAFAATKSESTEIWVKPTVGGDAVQVTKNGYFNQFPIWSPTGQELAFYSRRGDHRGIWRSSFTGGAQVQVGSDIGGQVRPVYWASSGKIYFQAGDELFSINEASGERSQVTDFRSKGLKPRVIEISQDESSIAYSIKDGDLWKVRVQRLNAEAFEDVAAVKDQVDYLAWHPKGRSVIFSNSVNGAFQIFEARLGQTVPVQLSTGNLDLFVEDVAPDGSKILYSSLNETSDLWRLDTQSMNESILANDVAAEYWADISPDGKRVVYQSVTQVNRPFSGSINVSSGSSAEPASMVAPLGFAPVWSPNGEWIAFFKRTASGIEIWRVGATGEDSLKLAEGQILTPAYSTVPYLQLGTNPLAWSPNSEALAYSARTNGLWNIWMVGADGTQARQLTANKDENEVLGGPVWLPDGNHLWFYSEYTGPGPSRQKGYRLTMYGVDGGSLRVVYDAKERFYVLGAAADGKNIIVAENANPAALTPISESANIYSLDAVTGTRSAVQTIENVYLNNIQLSNDGRTIAYVSRHDGSSEIWTVSVGGGAPKRVLTVNDPKVLFSTLAWAPDGRSIVFGKETHTNLLSMLTE